MNFIRKIKFPLFALAFSTAFVACSDDDSNGLNDGEGRLKISAKASYMAMGPEETSRTGNVELSSFLINFSEIELEFDDIIDEDNFYDSDDDVELAGPFEVDLLSNTPIEIVNVTLPNGRLEEIEFEFEKSNNVQSQLHNKSMKMEGTINATPFVFWHDFEEEIEIEFDDNSSDGIIANDNNDVVINFDLTTVLNLTPTVDLSTAVDGNGDGVIEISPTDDDGNRALAQAMKNAIKAQIDLLDD